MAQVEDLSRIDDGSKWVGVNERLVGQAASTVSPDSDLGPSD